ncbi:uncharacterized protein K452DRAFT_114526 [Aplosporella prunicola CBS 121167]|uniref:Uncharacterized protein n=1 Tax=Aplosporella prunicola CBS 121167 TaxID=1176127 RepID=A0A6A6AYH3_9PEZI|nr:uncharacterized protein K452DRAFT_114526 [Aplosporella prunicola CBS 121167]KAF2136982.1 hypothetical protein K452DRAFT_114526 [Aplosporella prunicola CBS 121167]
MAWLGDGDGDSMLCALRMRDAVACMRSRGLPYRGWALGLGLCGGTPCFGLAFGLAWDWEGSGRMRFLLVMGVVGLIVGGARYCTFFSFVYLWSTGVGCDKCAEETNDGNSSVRYILTK